MAGIGAAIVAANAPAISVLGAPPRSFAPFTTLPSHPLTVKRLFEAICDLGRQVERLGALTAEERRIVAVMIDDAIDEIRPIGAEVRVSAPLERIVSGEFRIEEDGAGTIDILGL